MLPDRVSNPGPLTYESGALLIALRGPPCPTTLKSNVNTYANANPISGPGCSKLTTSLANETLKFQMLIYPICQYFLLKKCEKLLQCKSFSHFFNKKYQCIWLKSGKTLNELTS